MKNSNDLTPRWEDFAVYLPAIQRPFARGVYKKSHGARPMPNGIALADLNFLNPKSKLWHYKYALYSAGQFAVGERALDAVTERDKSVTLLGDSGGFQIGKGKLPGFDKLKKFRTAEQICEAWTGAIATKLSIVNWLETHADYAMTIDMPLWAKLPQNKVSPFHKCSTEQLVKLTVENLRFIKANQRGQTKWLNVIQGTTAEDMRMWWDAVKRYRFSGWALAGDVGWRGGIESVLRQTLLMRDEGAFEKGQDWLHMLGVSQAKWAVLLTAMQRGLRAKVNPKLRISFDSASPTFISARNQQIALYPNFSKAADTWAMRIVRCPNFHQYVHSKHHFPFMSPVGEQLQLSHINVRAEKFDPKHFDETSANLLINHNTWVYVRAFLQANELAFLDQHDASQFVPKMLLEGLAFIEDIMQRNSWRSSMDKSSKLFAAIDRLKDDSAHYDDLR